MKSVVKLQIGERMKQDTVAQILASITEKGQLLLQYLREVIKEKYKEKKGSKKWADKSEVHKEPR